MFHDIRHPGTGRPFDGLSTGFPAGSVPGDLLPGGFAPAGRGLPNPSAPTVSVSAGSVSAGSLFAGSAPLVEGFTTGAPPGSVLGASPGPALAAVSAPVAVPSGAGRRWTAGTAGGPPSGPDARDSGRGRVRGPQIEGVRTRVPVASRPR